MSASERWVSAAALERLRKRVARLDARARRHGGTLELVDTGEREPRADGTELALVRIEGEGPRVEGWEVAARLRHGGAETRVEQLSDVAVDVARWRNAEPRCEHCALRRRRSTTFVLRHESGQLAQVGSSCVADFTGGREITANLLGQVSLRAAAVEELDEEARAVETVAIAEYLGHVTAIARRAGFVSGREASTETPATWERALERWRAGVELRADERAHGERVERWVLQVLRGRARPGYEARLVAAFSIGERIGVERARLVASAWRAHQLAERKARRDEHVGANGEAVEIVAEVEAIRPTRRQTRFGRVYLHSLRDDEGHVLSWFAPGQRLEKGARYRLRGTVERHRRFAGRAETVLARCEVLGVDGVGAGVAGRGAEG